MSTTVGMEFALFDILNILDIRVATFGDFQKFVLCNLLQIILRVIS